MTAYPAPTGQISGYPAPAYPYPAPGYPAPEIYPTPEGYPAPATPDTPPTPTVTPDVTKGYITGALRLNGQGVGDIILYLAEIVKDSSGQDRGATLSPVLSPNTTTDIEGKFIFTNISPGKYQLVLYTVINAYFLYYPGEKKEIIVTVEAGKTVEVGVLDYDTLPLPTAP